MSLLNRYVWIGESSHLIFIFYGLSLVVLEWLHTTGGLPSDFYLLIVRLYYWPIVWMIDHGSCPWWLAELLKGAA